jgi:DNA-directed RNA polymerase specialized sigma24 family protein
MTERTRLVNVAYRLLGSLAEAEDAVHEAYARWYAMSAQQQDAINSPGAWLTAVTSRICLDLLGQAPALDHRLTHRRGPDGSGTPGHCTGHIPTRRHPGL